MKNQTPLNRKGAGILRAAGLACAAAVLSPAVTIAQITDPFPEEFDVRSLSSGDGSLGMRIGGSTFGFSSMDGVADINGDGRAELILGEPAYGTNSRAYVVFGAASPGPTINVRDLTGANGFRVNDGLDSSNFGASVAGLGDVNGDGFGDVAVGAPGEFGGYGYYGPYGQPESSTYVIYGRSSAFPASFSSGSIGGSQPGARLEASASFLESGSSVAGIGDVNGDGLDDLIVGAPRGDYDDRGRGFLIQGGFDDRLRLEFAASSELVGEGFNEGAGLQVSAAGDLNADGHPDFTISSPRALSNNGRLHVVFGGPDLPNEINLGDLTGNDGFEVPRAGGNGTNGAGPAGDINGDGVDDLIVATNDNRAAVIFGRAGGGFPATFDLATLDGSNGFLIDGTGYLVDGGGDVNGDGLDDVIVSGFPGTAGNPGGVVFGRTDGFPASISLPDLDGTTGFRFIGGSFDTFGEVRIIPDFNGDGVDEIALLNTGSPPAAYIIYGRIVSTSCPADLDGDGDLTLFDFLEFQNLFDAGDPAADFDGDGSLTLFDFLEFQNQFDAGCP